jgi:hypothetical protein
MEEIWKDIPVYEGIYQVSNLGRIKSLKFGKEKILNGWIRRDGYIAVNLMYNKRKTYRLHQLIAITFLNHKPNGHKIVVDHIDNNKLNNRLDNLQLVSQRFNSSKDRKGSSKYTGVSWNKKRKKYESQIVINNKRKYLGLFENEYDAHLAYQNKLLTL